MIASYRRVLARAAYLSLYQYFGLYSPKAYVLTWIPRVLLETLFLALVAEFIGGPDLLRFAVIGFAAYRTVHTTVTFTTGSVTSELFTGTIPLLVGSPTDPTVVLTGRNLAWMFHGVSTGVLTVAVAALLGIPITVGSLILSLVALVIIELSAYALGLFVGSVLLRSPGLGNTFGNIVGFTLFAISGVTVPLASLPGAVQAVALAVPLSHGLLALREILGPGRSAVYVPLLLQEALIGCAYLGLALVSFRFFLSSARSRGTLDFQ
jgi:ABC-2 type transport system permease protein